MARRLGSAIVSNTECMGLICLTEHILVKAYSGLTVESWRIRKGTFRVKGGDVPGPSLCPLPLKQTFSFRSGGGRSEVGALQPVADHAATGRRCPLRDFPGRANKRPSAETGHTFQSG